MKKYWTYMVLTMVAICGLMQHALAQTYDAEGQYVDTVFHDHVNRQAEDFVTVSLLVADPTDWRDDMMGVTGHAFIRLQCPTFDLDYCFSYESEPVEGNWWRFLEGDLKMGLFCYTTESQIEVYQKWNRTIHEYQLNLPPDAEQRLWEIMDNHINNDIKLPMDMYKRGCAISLVHYVTQSLVDAKIEYGPWPEEIDGKSPKEIILNTLVNYPWIYLGSKSFTLDGRFERDCPNEDKLVIPAQLAEVWQKASLEGKPFAVYKGDLTKGIDVVVEKTYFTPILVAWIFLLLTICFACTKLPYWDWIMLSMQALVGLVLIYFACFSQQLGGSVLMLVVVFNPLPLLLWKYRRFWQLPYAVLLLIGTLVIVCWPRMLIDSAFVVWTLSYVVIFAKDSTKELIKGLWKRQ